MSEDPKKGPRLATPEEMHGDAWEPRTAEEMLAQMKRLREGRLEAYAKLSPAEKEALEGKTEFTCEAGRANIAWLAEQDNRRPTS
jgi:hypothetical protein